jgi:ABC-2 type transport system permease protein
MNIILREIKAHYKGLIGWSVGMLFLVIAGMAKYGAIATGGQQAIQLFNTFPKPVLVIAGIKGLDVGTVIGYFGVLYLYILLMATIHAAMIGAEVISKEERDRTSEFLYPKPITRSKIVTEKLVAAIINIVILNLITTISSIFTVAFYAKNYSNNNIVLILMAGLFIMQILFFALGSALAGLFKNPKLPSIVATAILLAAYIIWVVVDLNANLDFLKYVTPFKYFDASVIIKDGHLDPLYISLSITIIAVFITTTYLTFNKRDLKV